MSAPHPPAPAPWYRRWSWALLAFLAVLLVLFGVYVLFSPVDPNDFETETGLVWSDFSAAEPAVASYLEREARLLASVTIGFGLFAGGLAATLVRRGNRTSWALEWIFPAVLAITAVVFLAGESAGLGIFYLVVTVIAAVAVLFARPHEAA